MFFSEVSLLWCLLVVFVITNAYEPKEPIVETIHGSVRGLTQTSRDGRSYNSFRGIPYAKPPIGERRFAAPAPLDESWSFPIDATKEAPYCIQKNYFLADPKIVGQEDCLYLNIYVPHTENKTAKLPVMVFLHWGGFFAGSGASDLLGPEYFMDRDVVLVTLNYRLGVFGFLTTLDDEAPGNYALKDQVLALKFIQQVIEPFGGDKNRVTLFGQSAGAGSTSLHLVSPLSKNLFHRAISQSGVALDLWARPFNALQRNITAYQAFFVNCTDNMGDSKALVACFRDIDATVLVNSGDRFKIFSTEPLIPYTLVTETKSARNPEPFLTQDPLAYFLNGDFQKVPYIVGNVQDEGILRAAPLLRQPELVKTLNKNFSYLIPQMLLLPFSNPDAADLLANVTDFYLGGNYSFDVENPASVQGLIDLYTDRAFVYGTYQSVIVQSLQGHKPIWLYNFAYRGNFSYGDIFAGTDNNISFNWGVSHCDDLLYLFKSPSLFKTANLTGEDLEVSNYLLDLWTNFAALGNPDPENTTNWQSLQFANESDIKNENLAFLNITSSAEGVKKVIERGWYPKRMAFWRSQELTENFKGLL